MFDSTALNVVISLSFIFLLYSLLATTINEGLAATFSLRAKKLEQAIARMLDDGVMYHHNVWDLIGDMLEAIVSRLKKIVLFLSLKKRHKPKEKMTLVEAFYEQPGIKYLAQNKISNRPSYINPESFSKAVIDVLKEKANNPEASNLQQIKDGISAMRDANETKGFIQSLLNDANNDLEKFRTSLEAWFNETMHRTSGWYKRQSQKITFVIGFVLAIAFNVDTISLVKKLSNDPQATQVMANMATQYIETHKDDYGHYLSYNDSLKADSLLSEVRSQINGEIKDANSVMGLGWEIPYNISNGFSTKNELASGADSVNCEECLVKIKNTSLFGHKPYMDSENAELSTLGKIRYVWCMASSGWRKLIGYLITALAISFGAPFWFDLLNKLIQLRGSGKRPEETPAAKNNNEQTPQVNRVG